MTEQAPTPLRILFIDDDSFVIDMYTRKLAQRGHTVQIYSRAVLALDALRKNLTHQQMYDILICDLLMPEMSGFDFLKIVHDEHLLEGVPIIILSNQNEADDYRKVSEYNVYAAFVKAHSLPDEIVSLIERTYDAYRTPQGRGVIPHQ